MSLARNLIERLRAAMATMGSARSAVVAARDQADELIAEVTAATDGTSDERPAEAIVRWQQAQVRLDEAMEELQAGEAALEEYIADGLGGEGDSPSGSGGIGSIPTTGQCDRDKLPSFDPQQYLDALPAMTPKRQRKSGQKTRGTWIVDGEDDQELISGDGSDADKAEAHWAKIRRPDEPRGLTIYGDVEPKFAMQMRDENVTQARIVINNPDGPCGYGKGWQYGCDALLSRFLAPGSQLTVVWPGPTEKTYTGQHESDQE